MAPSIMQQGGAWKLRDPRMIRLSLGHPLPHAPALRVVLESTVNQPWFHGASVTDHDRIKDGQSIHIGFSIGNPRLPFWAMVAHGAREEAAKRGIAITMSYAASVEDQIK